MNFSSPKDHAPADASRLATAYHESGHAVIALHLGRSIHKVTIEAQLNRLGQCQLAAGAGRPAQNLIEREALILLAGFAAEARATGCYHPAAAAIDFRQLDDLLDFQGGNDRQRSRTQRRWLDKVESLIDRPKVWSAIAAIAEALLTQTTISGRAARHLYELEMQKHS